MDGNSYFFLKSLWSKYPDSECQALGYHNYKGILYLTTHAMDTNPFSETKTRESKKQTKTKIKRKTEQEHD